MALSDPMPFSPTQTRSILVLLLLAAGVTTLMLTTRPPAEPVPMSLRDLRPGGTQSLLVEGRAWTVSVPAGEGHTYGTFEIQTRSPRFMSGPLERDGSMESAWTADLNGSGKKDLVIAVRNGGSGSYINLWILENTPAGPRVRRVPPLPPGGFPGYMGHDTISVHDGRIFRAFPTYVHAPSVRIDRQWKPKQGLQGTSPIKRDPDANAAPSGETTTLYFNLTANRWERP